MRRTTAIGLTTLAALILFLGLFDWSPLTGPLARLMSHALHRKVQIGRFSAHLLRWTPSVTLQNVQIDNPSWAAGKMAQITRINAAVEAPQLLIGRVVLSRLEFSDAHLDLERDARARSNWDFNAAAENSLPPKPNGAPPHFPAVRRFTLRGGKLTINDAVRKLHFEGSVAANEHAAHPELEPLRVEGRGTLNGKAFELTFQGNALFNLQLNQPYHFSSDVRAGSLGASIRGSIDKPFDFAHFGAALDIRGPNLAGLYYLTGLALPFTPPFHFAGQLRNDNNHFSIGDVEAIIGQSDLHGNIRLDASGARPLLEATLTSRLFNLGDLAPSLGAGVSDQPTKADLTAPSTQPAPHGLLPTYRFEFDRLRSTDAAVTLRAASVKARSMPVKALSIDLRLNKGVLSLSPLEFTLPKGRITSAIRVDARTASATTAIDLRLQDVDLAGFKSGKMSESPLEGALLGRAQLAGRGNSVHEILGSSNGTITAIIPHGEVREAFAQLTGIDVARGLGLLIAHSRKEVTIGCGIAAFRVQNGLAHAEPLVVDTNTVKITASGNFNFEDETLHLQLQGQPKTVMPFRLHAPIVLGGTFIKPSFGIKPGSLLAQAGIAAALGVIATPAAAMLAFVDPGLARNADCAALLSGPQAKSTEHPGPPGAAPPKPSVPSRSPH